MEHHWTKNLRIFTYRFLSLVIGVFIIFQVKESYSIRDRSTPYDDGNPIVPYILTGVTPKNNMCPSLVAIKRMSNGTFEYRCGGTLITDTIVITGARCVSSIRNQTLIPIGHLKVVEGGIDVSEENIQKYHLKVGYPKNVYVHPAYKYEGDYDMALIELQTPLIFNGSSTIKLNTDKMYGEHNCVICGYGKTSENGTFQDGLQGAYVTVFERFCPVTGPNGLEYQELYDNWLCSSDIGTYTRGACAGDEGGPLYCKGTLTGVISTRYHKEKGCGPPNFYTSIRIFRNWLIEKISHVIARKQHP